MCPYLGGEEVNTSPVQAFRRYVINFGEMSLEEAGRWPELLQVLKKRVKPERERTKDALGFPWWQFWRPRNELYTALAPLERCLVAAIVSKHLMFSFQPAGRILLAQAVRFSTEPLHAVCCPSVSDSRPLGVAPLFHDEDGPQLLRL